MQTSKTDKYVYLFAYFILYTMTIQVNGLNADAVDAEDAAEDAAEGLQGRRRGDDVDAHRKYARDDGSGCSMLVHPYPPSSSSRLDIRPSLSTFAPVIPSIRYEPKFTQLSGHPRSRVWSNSSQSLSTSHRILHQRRPRLRPHIHQLRRAKRGLSNSLFPTCCRRGWNESLREYVEHMDQQIHVQKVMDTLDPNFAYECVPLPLARPSGLDCSVTAVYALHAWNDFSSLRKSFSQDTRLAWALCFLAR
jgi:hypothetical protein